MSRRYPFPAVYIMASRPYGVLYTGSSADLPRRVWEHREGLLDGFTAEHGCGLLVWYEHHELMTEAIRRERAIKRYKRAWKLELIERLNPDWRDLYGDLIWYA